MLTIVFYATMLVQQGIEPALRAMGRTRVQHGVKAGSTSVAILMESTPYDPRLGTEGKPTALVGNRRS